MIPARSITPLRYPGGKGFLARPVAQWLRASDVQVESVIEPYAGGAGLSISLLMGGFTKKVCLNDKFFPLWAFWQIISSKGDAVVRFIENVELTIENFLKYRQIILKPDETRELEVALALLYFSRTSHAGALTGGPIGGYKQDTRWKIDARFNREDLASRVRAISSLGTMISSSNIDGIEFLNKQFSRTDDSLVFIDPPYYKKGRNLYRDWMTHEDYFLLRDLLRDKQSNRWILTIDNCDETRKIFGEFGGSTLPVRYTVWGSRAEKELILFSERCLDEGIEAFIQ